MNLQCIEGQGFGLNYNPSYSAGGLLGHTAIDESCGYGSPIASYVDGEVYSLFTPQKPASDGFTAIYALVRTPLEVFEWSVGHVSEIDVSIGETIHKGDVIGKEGNKGTVYSGNIKITLAMQAAGDKRGAHRHVQKRPVFATKSPTSNILYTSKGSYKDEDGYFYQVYNYNNGFVGCVDWTKPLFPRNLYIGISGYDVFLLQRACVLEGFADYEPTGFFGAKTFAGLQRLQKAHGIPNTGFCGELTRKYLNSTYFQI